MSRSKYEISEEILQRGILNNPDMIGKYIYYNIGNTFIGSLRDCGLIENRDYSDENRKPDGLIVDKTKRVIAVIENKSLSKYKTEKQKNSATNQALEVAKDLKAKFVISTDSVTSRWYNAYNGEQILNYDGTPLSEVFGVTTSNTPKMEKLIETLDLTINPNCSKISEEHEIDPTPLAYSIWQKIYKATAATPENCLYTFVEIFIFKYLSDLNLLSNMYSFNYVINMYKNAKEDDVLTYYAKVVRPEIKRLFPQDKDGTTIINGSIFVSERTGESITGYGKTFRSILEMFDGEELRNIDKDFKSKIFEVFFKKDSQKGGMGQYFTPLKVVQQIVNMADIKPGMRICDPACGVGKFLLEAVSRNIDDLYEIKGNALYSKVILEGYDKGFTKDSERTIILAKANMMIYFSDLIKNNQHMTTEFSNLFNKTFHLRTSVLGTLDYIPSEKQKYDLILSNPPYVGTTDVYKKEIDGNATLKKYYNKNGTGLEGLFIEWIIRSLADNGQAFIIVPEGFMYRIQDVLLRQFMMDECIINAIISLPLNTFFSTNKKTYILSLTKKSKNNKKIQNDPVFTYLCSSTGETLDINRFDIAENDLADAAYEYHSFKGNKKLFYERVKSGKLSNPRLKVIDFKWLDENVSRSWVVDNLWSDEEKVELGIKDEEKIMTSEEFSDFIDKVINDLIAYKEAIKNVK